MALFHPRRKDGEVTFTSTLKLSDSLVNAAVKIQLLFVSSPNKRKKLAASRDNEDGMIGPSSCGVDDLDRARERGIPRTTEPRKSRSQPALTPEDRN